MISSILPTQTSIYSDQGVDATLIADLQKPQGNGKISRVQAIGLAELYCAMAHSLPKVNPSNLEAKLMTEKEAKDLLEQVHTGFSSKTVWLASMDGLWEHAGLPAPEGEAVVPILFNHCDVIIDAKSGESLSLRSIAQP